MSKFRFLMSKSRFFTKHIFVRKLPFYVKILLFYRYKCRENGASCFTFKAI